MKESGSPPCHYFINLRLTAEDIVIHKLGIQDEQTGTYPNQSGTTRLTCNYGLCPLILDASLVGKPQVFLGRNGTYTRYSAPRSAMNIQVKGKCERAE